VDDEEVFAQALKLWLDARERIEVAHDGPEAIDLALFNDAQVVLMDIGLPKFDGLAASDRSGRMCA